MTTNTPYAPRSRRIAGWICENSGTSGGFTGSITQNSPCASASQPYEPSVKAMCHSSHVPSPVESWIRPTNVNGLIPFFGLAPSPSLNGEEVATSSATCPIASRSTPLRATAARQWGQTDTTLDPARNETSPPHEGQFATRELTLGPKF